MNYLKVQFVRAVDNYTLVVKFDNKQRKKYDIAPLLEKNIFAPLKNPSLFKSVRVQQGGYAVFWNSNIDINEYELWRHGQTLP